ncbi:MAG: trypsin-like peptidase domain-containing protein [Planctomycetaceae bacterium]
MKFFAGCFLSAVLGATCCQYLGSGRSWDAAFAQERGGFAPSAAERIERIGPSPNSAPRLPGPAFAPPPGPTAHLFDGTGLTPEEAINVAVYERANKGVVNITTRSTRVEGFFLLEQSSEGSGSGAVIDRAGHVVTNLHVVEGADQVMVTLFDGKSHEATPVGADPVNDIAVLRIDAPADSLHPIQLGDSSRLKVGMRVFAIGNPFGLERTMTTGIVSSLNRSLKVRGNRTVRQIIQIDAAVNPGNSGGPLLDAHGTLIGLNTAIASRTGQSAGVGFAIPSNLLRRVVPQLVRHGRVIRPEIGIQRVYETERGLLVATVTPEGPAAEAGLRGPRTVRQQRGLFVFDRVDRSAADLIVGVDGEPVKTADDFLGYIESKQPGDQVVLTVIRDEERIEVPVRLGDGRPEQEAAARPR